MILNNKYKYWRSSESPTPKPQENTSKLPSNKGVSATKKICRINQEFLFMNKKIRKYRKARKLPNF